MGERGRRAPSARVLLLSAVNAAALGSLTAPAIIGLPAQIARLVPAGERAGVLAFVVTCGAVGALGASPLLGFLSDRTRSRFGRRRPWLLAGMIGTLLAALALVAAPSVAATAAAWVAMQVLCNATLTAADALFADSVPESQRAAGSGIYGAAAFLGALPALVLTALLPSRVAELTVAIPAAALVVVALALPRLREPDAPMRPARAAVGARRLDPGAAPGFLAVWLQRLCFQLSSALLLAFPLYFVMDRMRRTEEDATPIVSASTALGGAVLVVAAVVAGLAAARRGDYRPYLVGAILGLAAASVLRALTTGPVLLWVGAALGGAAMGVFTAVAMALALRTIPTASSGARLGALNVANALGQLVAPSIATALLGVGGADPVSGGADDYTALYLAAAGVAAAALATLPRLGAVARAPLSAAPSPPR